MFSRDSERLIIIMSDAILSKIVGEKVADLAHSIGITATARKLGVNKHAIPKIAAGLPVRAGTLLAAARGLGIHIGAPAPLAITALPSASDIQG